MWRRANPFVEARLLLLCFVLDIFDDIPLGAVPREDLSEGREIRVRTCVAVNRALLTVVLDHTCYHTGVQLTLVLPS